MIRIGISRYKQAKPAAPAAQVHDIFWQREPQPPFDAPEYPDDSLDVGPGIAFAAPTEPLEGRFAAPRLVPELPVAPLPGPDLPITVSKPEESKNRVNARTASRATAEAVE